MGVCRLTPQIFKKALPEFFPAPILISFVFLAQELPLQSSAQIKIILRALFSLELLA
jgi:hypothetical protein